MESIIQPDNENSQSTDEQEENSYEFFITIDKVKDDATGTRNKVISDKKTRCEELVKRVKSLKNMLNALREIVMKKRNYKENDCMKRTDKPKLKKCELCSKTFVQMFSLKKHMMSHAGLKLHKCEICNNKFTERGSLNRHMRIHSGSKPFTCEFCRKGFNQRSSLTDHMTNHIGDKPFICNVCDKGFLRKSDLNKHQLCHSGIKPFQCDVCQRSFTQKAHLVRHFIVHTGDKPFKCTVESCGKVFTQKPSLNQHFRKHSKCNTCNRMFFDDISLNKHKCQL